MMLKTARTSAWSSTRNDGQPVLAELSLAVGRLIPGCRHRPRVPRLLGGLQGQWRIEQGRNQREWGAAPPEALLGTSALLGVSDGIRTHDIQKYNWG
jgi:hypothetical protein